MRMGRGTGSGGSVVCGWRLGSPPRVSGGGKNLAPRIATSVGRPRRTRGAGATRVSAHVGHACAGGHIRGRPERSRGRPRRISGVARFCRKNPNDAPRSKQPDVGARPIPSQRHATRRGSRAGEMITHHLDRFCERTGNFLGRCAAIRGRRRRRWPGLCTCSRRGARFPEEPVEKKSAAGYGSKNFRRLSMVLEVHFHFCVTAHTHTHEIPISRAPSPVRFRARAKVGII